MREFTAQELRKAMELHERDARARALAASCVAYAIQEYGPIDPEKASSAAHYIASLATNLLVSRIYLEDTELRELKEEVERYKQLAFDTVARTPRPLVIPK
jgi:hypothetical protein